MSSIPGDIADDVDVARKITGLWWIWLVLGICWIAASLVILQFNHASVTTIGIITGIMFIVAGMQQLTLAFVADSLKWLWAFFGVIFLIAGVICFISPADTFRGLADILGFLFLTVGIWWTIRAFLLREIDSTWWLGLIAGILMIILAFWTSGQLFIHRAYVLVVFAGIWALMEGIMQIFRAFAIRSVHKSI
jgi:uncharacterized membrane protein HdeD (DUF308 family)